MLQSFLGLWGFCSNAWYWRKRLCMGVVYGCHFGMKRAKSENLREDLHHVLFTRWYLFTLRCCFWFFFFWSATALSKIHGVKDSERGHTLCSRMELDAYIPPLDNRKKKTFGRWDSRSVLLCASSQRPLPWRMIGSISASCCQSLPTLAPQPKKEWTVIHTWFVKHAYVFAWHYHNLYPRQCPHCHFDFTRCFHFRWPSVSQKR